MDSTIYFSLYYLFKTHVLVHLGIHILYTHVLCLSQSAQLRHYHERPWNEYSWTEFMKTYLDDLIDSTVWKDFNGTNFALNTVSYEEYMNIVIHIR